MLNRPNVQDPCCRFTVKSNCSFQAENVVALTLCNNDQMQIPVRAVSKVFVFVFYHDYLLCASYTLIVFIVWSALRLCHVYMRYVLMTLAIAHGKLQ